MAASADHTERGIDALLPAEIAEKAKSVGALKASVMSSVSWSSPY